MRIIRGYGLALRQLQHDDIEMVRRWRNDPKVSSFMAFREHISKEQQEAWFKSVDNENNHFFIIEDPSGPVGMCELKKIDREKFSAEGGIFFYDEQTRNSPQCVAVAVLVSDYGFKRLGLLKIYAQILDDNPRAIRFNKCLGYELVEQGEAGKSVYVLTADSFRKASAKIKQGLRIMLGQNSGEKAAIVGTA
jgi:UDP-4-amino-4,6-dideoxy-N-acetyl-beta-L-altrosamine N-acetyltransferase